MNKHWKLNQLNKFGWTNCISWSVLQMYESISIQISSQLHYLLELLLYKMHFQNYSPKKDISKIHFQNHFVMKIYFLKDTMQFIIGLDIL